MSFYTSTAAEAQMNAWGEAQVPFLFIIDYEQRRIVLSPQKDWQSLDADFAFPQITHQSSPSVESADVPSIRIATPSREEYSRAFQLVRHHLLRGDSFLTNLTMRMPLQTSLSLRALYPLVHARYKMRYADSFLCFSPESFVQIERSGRISTYPMKGTIDATLPDAETLLLRDAKEQAEHATVVDLLRNDLSRIAHDVQVARYRYVERVQTQHGEILQTSSEIVGQLPQDWQAHLGTLLFQMLPAGSITGAPKPMTCQIIRQAEGCERGYYTGVMGYFDGACVDSAVMIRFIEKAEDGLFYRAGGGITARSEEAAEYHEVIQKSYVPIHRNH